MTTSSDTFGAIGAVLEDLAALSDRAGLKEVVRELRDDRISALRERRFTMVVLGEFNHGKSSTINALLGTTVLPTGITPTTSVITQIRYGTGPAKVVREGGVTALGASELRGFVTTEPPEDLRHIEVEIASELLKDGLVVVDTPGVNDISQAKVEITWGYVPRADIVLYVLDATQALKRSEITFIRDRLLRNSLDRVFFVLGKADVLDDAELAEVRDHVTARLTELVGEPRLFAISAKRAAQGSDPGFNALREALGSYIRLNRDAIVRDGAVRAGLRLTSMADQSLAIEQGAIGLSADELARRVESVKQRLVRSRTLVSENLALLEQRRLEIRAGAVDEVREFAQAFAAALPTEIARAQTDEIKRYLPDFIQDTFKNMVEGEGTQLAMRLEQLAEEIITITNRNMREVVGGVQQELGVPSREIDLEVDTFGYDVGVFALGALGVSFLAFSNLLVGGVLTLSAPILAFVLKDRVETTIRDRALEQGLAAISKASTKVSDEFGRIVDEFAARLRQFVEDAGDRLYRQVVEALERAQADHTTTDAATAARREQLAGVRDELQHLRSRLLAIASEAASGG